ncbi:hypothetical protein [Corynebacterium meitnerae]|uniref:Secreted protein n=1 Tax=Corynebacterium meitnerae TaxID=2913498 RepID=A0A9X3RIA0_9CORY|nr:hypothetical protein [Corynebacterium meitnerae]MCZ9293164.1 hypothetical protein [Corynebacterium meitnerae]
MSTSAVIAFVVLVLLAVALWAIFTARRLDCLHIRVDRARRALDHVLICGDPACQRRHDLAVRFYNNAVADTRRLRLRPVIRVLRLAGTAPLPEFFPFAKRRADRPREG